MANAKTEMENAERSLAGMMDKVRLRTGMVVSKQRLTYRTPAMAFALSADWLAASSWMVSMGHCTTCLKCLTSTSRLSRSRPAPGGPPSSSIAMQLTISLFHVVVDNDETASKLLDVMNKEKLGRVTFMPLNRLKSVNVQYPKANDALPMISKLKFDRAYVMAFEQVNDSSSISILC